MRMCDIAGAARRISLTRKGMNNAVKQHRLLKRTSADAVCAERLVVCDKEFRQLRCRGNTTDRPRRRSIGVEQTPELLQNRRRRHRTRPRFGTICPEQLGPSLGVTSLACPTSARVVELRSNRRDFVVVAKRGLWTKALKTITATDDRFDVLVAVAAELVPKPADIQCPGCPDRGQSGCAGGCLAAS